MEVSVRTARQELAELINRAHYRGEHVIIMRHGKPVAALISIETLRAYQEAEDRCDVQDSLSYDPDRDGAIPMKEAFAQLRAKREAERGLSARDL
jgi:prevent-host-death family protein